MCRKKKSYLSLYDMTRFIWTTASRLFKSDDEYAFYFHICIQKRSLAGEEKVRVLESAVHLPDKNSDNCNIIKRRGSRGVVFFLEITKVIYSVETHTIQFVKIKLRKIIDFRDLIVLKKIKNVNTFYKSKKMYFKK